MISSRDRGGLKSVVAVRGAATEDGGRLFFAMTEFGRSEIASDRPDGKGFRRLTRSEPGASFAQWMDDGTIVFWSENDSSSGWWRLRGGRLESLPGREYDALSPSGRFAARVTHFGLRIVNGSGRSLRSFRFLSQSDFVDGSLLWSLDERYVALAVVTESKCCLYERIIVVRVDGTEPVRWLSPRRDGVSDAPFKWLAGDRLVGLVGGKVLVMGADGSGKRPVPHGSQLLDISTDGRQIVFFGRGGCVLVSSSALGARSRLVRPAPRKGIRTWEINALWSPDGTRLAIYDSDGTWIVGADGRALRKLTQRNGIDLWSPDGGRLVLTDAAGLWALRVRDGRLTRLTRSIRDDAAVAPPDGSRVAFVRLALDTPTPGERAVFTVGANGTDAVRIGRGYGAHWSPAGTEIAFVDPLRSEPSGMGDWRSGRIWISRPDGRAKHAVAVGTEPAWSPDGSQIAFMRYTFRPRLGRKGEFEIATGTLSIVRSERSEAHVVARWSAEVGDELYSAPSWAPDGSSLLLLGGEDHPWALVLAATDEVRPIDGPTAAGYVWSPSGDLLAYSNSSTLNVVHSNGTGRRVLARVAPYGDIRSPAWSPDGARIAFVRCTDLGCDLVTVRSDGTGIVRVMRGPAGLGAPSWSR